ncbi:MAG: hypothetical protein SO373_05930 [Candidatus Borkfalkiaceae bacterium]|nr:hypothetical protein [Christensenellaceae bacterium]
MRIWLEREGMLGTKKPRFFAVVEEEMIDKNGRTVAAPPKTAETTETAPVAAPETSESVTVVASEPVDNEKLDEIERKVKEINSKVDSIIESLKTSTEEVTEETMTEETAEGVTEEPAEEVDEEPAAEETVEEVAEEPAAEETVEEVAEEPATEETAEEVAEESATEETTEEVTEEPAAEETVEEVAAASAEELPLDMVEGTEGVADVEKKGYVRSPNFAEKMLAASEIIQDRYDELKNYALRFRKLKARISKKFDSINMGRFHFVKLSVAGKTLKLYLNMDISTVDPKFRCVDMSGKKTYVTVPVMLRIKSGRAMKYAKRLIDQCAEQNGMLERRKPFEVDAMQLIEEAVNGITDNENELDIDLDNELENAFDETAATEVDETSEE